MSGKNETKASCSAVLIEFDYASNEGRLHGFNAWFSGWRKPIGLLINGVDGHHHACIASCDFGIGFLAG